MIQIYRTIIQKNPKIVDTYDGLSPKQKLHTLESEVKWVLEHIARNNCTMPKIVLRVYVCV